MYKDIRKLWIDALKNAKCGQCKRVLRHGNKRCPFGILGEILVAKFKNFTWLEDGLCYNEIPIMFCKHRGMIAENFQILPTEVVRNVIDLNDRKRCDFKTISEWLEENTVGEKLTLKGIIKRGIKCGTYHNTVQQS